jgi:hypothetical protein
MTTYPIIAATGDSTVLPIGADELLTGDKENIWYTSPDGNSRFYIAGALAPWPGIQDGIVLTGGLHGLSPEFKNIDLKSARQPGVTFTGTLYDTLNLDMNLQAHANTPQGMSKVISEWVGAWDPTKTGTLEYWTLDRGYWFNNTVRLAKTWGDTWKQSWRTIKMAQLTHSCRFDNAFWQGFPSIDGFAPGGGSEGGSSFLQLTNIGDQDAFPTFLFYGPGTFTFSNGPGGPPITFGPLEAGQVVLMPTNPRLNNVVNLTAGVPQALSVEQQTIAAIINFVTNNNVPPYLQQFESLFGILPPQGSLWTLLKGRYDTPIPGVSQPAFATQSEIAVTITGTGGSSASKIVARIDPMRRWPE